TGSPGGRRRSRSRGRRRARPLAGRSQVKTATDRSEARGCLLMLGWLYVLGLVVALIVAAWAAAGSNPGDLLSREGLYVVLSGVLFVVGWPLLIPALLGRP